MYELLYYLVVEFKLLLLGSAEKICLRFLRNITKISSLFFRLSFLSFWEKKIGERSLSLTIECVEARPRFLVLSLASYVDEAEENARGTLLLRA